MKSTNILGADNFMSIKKLIENKSNNERVCVIFYMIYSLLNGIISVAYIFGDNQENTTEWIIILFLYMLKGIMSIMILVNE